MSVIQRGGNVIDEKQLVYVFLSTHNTAASFSMKIHVIKNGMHSTHDGAFRTFMVFMLGQHKAS